VFVKITQRRIFSGPRQIERPRQIAAIRNALLIQIVRQSQIANAVVLFVGIGIDDKRIPAAAEI
jgi:hypothetical protein